MIVGITGTRKGLTPKQFSAFHNLMMSNDVEEIHHGDCHGVDQQIDYETKHVYPGVILKKYLPKIRKSKYFLRRNREIVDSCNVLWAFPKSENEELRSGTWATIRYCRKKNKPSIIIYPDGRLNGRVYSK